MNPINDPYNLTFGSESSIWDQFQMEQSRRTESWLLCEILNTERSHKHVQVFTFQLDWSVISPTERAGIPRIGYRKTFSPWPSPAKPVKIAAIMSTSEASINDVLGGVQNNIHALPCTPAHRENELQRQLLSRHQGTHYRYLLPLQGGTAV